jgi:luciferase family oxidoreductase group 1
VSVPLNILCQSPVSEGMTPSDAVGHTVELAVEAERLGYQRFWVAEHHSDKALASGAPEVLVAAIAARTSTLRVGSGGVLLPYYQPFKVAEQFNLLEALFPGRIDLGLGRSGGSERHAPDALGLKPERMAAKGAFAAIDELLSWLGKGADERPFPDTFASPQIETSAEPWVLGTSPASATFAGERGLPYTFGGFLDPRGMVDALTAYHQAFQASRWCERPRVNLAWYVQAAETEEEASAMARSSEHWFIETFMRGRNLPFPSDETVAAATYSPTEQMAIAMRRQYAIIGTAEQVVDRLNTLQRQTHADELTLVTIPSDPKARLASYALIAAASGLHGSSAPNPSPASH